MQCRDVRELADSFLSEQLLVETNHELLRHLETCPDCRSDIADRRALRDGLRTAFARAEDLRPRPEFAAELRARLRPAQPEISRRSVLQSWWALAAGVVLAAGGGLFVRNSSSRSRLAPAGARGGRRSPELRRQIQSRGATDSARRGGAPLRCAVRRARDVRAASGRRTAGDARAAFLCLSGPPVRPRRLSLPRRDHLVARHRRDAAGDSRAGAERRRARRWRPCRQDVSSDSSSPVSIVSRSCAWRRHSLNRCRDTSRCLSRRSPPRRTRIDAHLAPSPLVAARRAHSAVLEARPLLLALGPSVAPDTRWPVPGRRNILRRAEILASDGRRSSRERRTRAIGRHRTDLMVRNIYEGVAVCPDW